VSHAVAACALGVVGRPRLRMPPRFWVAAAIAAALPDVDVLAFTFGIPYSDMFGHRGITHSLCFAALAALVIVKLTFGSTAWQRHRFAMVIFFFVAIASHGMLDAMTSGGLGIAFFAPFSGRRYFFPWRPILVSPIGLQRFFSPRGMAVVASEIVWVWVPSAMLALAGWAMRRR
jgi:inner membrane protein